MVLLFLFSTVPTRTVRKAMLTPSAAVAAKVRLLTLARPPHERPMLTARSVVALIEEDNFDDHWFSCTKKWKAIHPGGQWYGSP